VCRSWLVATPASVWISTSTGLPVEHVRLLLRCTPRSIPLEAGHGDDSVRPLLETLRDSRDRGPPDSAIRRDLARRIRGHLAGLEARDRRILTLRFGLGSDRPMPLRAVGKLLGLSPERVRQLELAALCDLRGRLRGAAGSVRT